MASRDRSSEHHYCLPEVRVVEFEVVATVKKMTVLGALVLVLAGAGTASPGQFLYRCLTLDHTDHFVSPSAECEGTTTEQVLGCTAPCVHTY